MSAIAIDAPPAGASFAYLEGALQSGQIAADARVFQPLAVRARDGHRLQAFSAGRPGAPAVLLVNPLGIPCLFMARLAQRLAGRFHVLTWEHRGLPDQRADVPATLDAHTRDAADLLCAATGAARCHGLLSYCSGAHVAALALAHGALAARRLCLVSPSFDLGPGAPRTAYQDTVMPLWPRVVRDGERMAAIVRALMAQAARPGGTPLDVELDLLNRTPFGSDAQLLRYAALLAQTQGLDVPALLARIAVPALVLHSEHDDIVHKGASRGAADLLARGRFELQAGDGHFAIYRNAAMQERIAAFLLQADDAAEAAP